MLGYVATFLLRWKLQLKGQGVDIRIGSINFSLLAGKIAFRNVTFATESYAITVVDGYIVARYWLRNYRQLVKQTQATRVLVQLNGLSWVRSVVRGPVAVAT